MRNRLAVVLAVLGTVAASGQTAKMEPTFRVKVSDIHLPLTFILYGDQRLLRTRPPTRKAARRCAICW